jgi:hypothetical protein
LALAVAAWIGAKLLAGGIRLRTSRPAAFAGLTGAVSVVPRDATDAETDDMARPANPEAVIAVIDARQAR